MTQTDDCPIVSARHKILGIVGQGCWGTVFKAKDTATGEIVALKALTPTDIAQDQMVQRGLTETDVLRRESGRFTDTTNVVPRTLEFDDNENPFVRMPIYERTLADAVNEHTENRLSTGRGLSLETAFRYLRGISNGIHEIQTKYGQIHPDISLDNIVLNQEDNPLLTDLGSATVTTLEGTSSPRDNIGSIVTRAYECFAEGSHPSRRSNSWAVGSLAYRLFTGECIYEAELKNIVDPIKFMIELDPKVADTIVKTKVNKNIPKPFRKFIRSCLSHDPDKRPQDGTALKRDLERAISQHYKSRPSSRLKRWGLAAAALSTVIGTSAALWYADKAAQEANQATQEAKKATQLREHDKKVTVIRDWLKAEEKRDRWEFYIEEGELVGWIYMFKDRKTAFAAYLNPNATYEAIQETGSKNYEDIEKYFWENKIFGISNAINQEIPGGGTDNLTRIMRNDRTRKVEEKWKEAAKIYGAKKEKEKEKERMDRMGRLGVPPIDLDNQR